MAADYFLADDLRREQQHVGNLLAYFFAGVEEYSLQFPLLAFQDEVAADFLDMGLV